MILTCPSCATSYFVPAGAVGAAGRAVRCKACGHSWRASADEPLELARVAATPDPEPEPVDSLAETPAPELPKAFRARAEQQRRLRRAAAHGAAWSAMASVFVGLLGAAWLFRVEVVELLPRTAAAYAAVGVPVNATGLEFEAVMAKPSPNDPALVLVTGAVRNVRDEEVLAPPIRVALLDAHGAEIGHKLVRPDGPPVLPGKVQGFAALIPDPGAKGQGVGVDFEVAAGRTRPVTDAQASRGADHAPAHRPLPQADAPKLRPALAPLEGAGAPVDAVPLDAGHAQAASAADHGPAHP